MRKRKGEASEEAKVFYQLSVFWITKKNGFCEMCNCSLKEHTVAPALWRLSIISPVPRKSYPMDPHDFSPVSLASVIIKCFELPGAFTNPTDKADPLLFAYHWNQGVDDALLTLRFIDFSIAFNTIQPHLMVWNPVNMHIVPQVNIW